MMADILCPSCGKTNPPGTEDCLFCGTRLEAPSSPPLTDSQPIRAGDKPVRRQTSELERIQTGPDGLIHPGEKPTLKNTGELERALPSWLRSLREGESPPPDAGQPPQQEVPGLPLEPSASAAPGEAPGPLDWLAGLESAAEEDETVAAWMADLNLPTSSRPAPAGMDSGEEELPLPGPAEGPVPPEQEFVPLTPAEPEEVSPEWLSRLEGGQASPLQASGLFSAGPPSLPPDSPSEAQAVPDEELPDWLKEMKSGVVASADAPAQPLPGEDLPDWLSNLPVIKPGESDAAAEIDPEWLSSLKEAASGEAQSSTLPADAPVEESPDWLASLPEIPSAQPASEPGAGSDWLAGLKGETPPSTEAEIPAQPAPAGSTPDWLDRLGSSTGTTDAKSVFTSEPSQPALGDWLSQLQSDIKQASTDAEQAGEFEQAVGPFLPNATGEELPDWLAGVERSAAAGASTPALITPAEEADGGSPGQAAFSLETPDWLTKLRPERAKGSAQPALEPDEPGTLETADLPSWVQAMRPLEAVVSEAGPQAENESALESAGPLAGLRGVLPVSPGMGRMRKPPAYSLKLQVNSSQQRNAAQLEKMLVEEGQAGKPRAARRESGRLLRLAIAAVLLLAVFLPLAVESRFTPAPALFPSEWKTTSLLLDALPAEAPLLLVFDYDPALSGELEVAAASVVDHLLYSGSRLAFLSTSPTGPALGEQFLASTQSYHLGTGLLVANLGFLAGGPAGIQSFAADPAGTMALTVAGEPAWDTPALQGVSRLEDFSALIVLTDNADTGRNWIEQTRQAIGATPIIMIISAQAEPVIRPYFDSGQVQGLVTGLAGGMAYETSYATPGLARRYWDSFGLGTLAAILLVAGGSAWGLFRSWRKPGKKGAGT